jgi:hypothetical protein
MCRSSSSSDSSKVHAHTLRGWQSLWPLTIPLSAVSILTSRPTVWALALAQMWACAIFLKKSAKKLEKFGLKVVVLMSIFLYCRRTHLLLAWPTPRGFREIWCHDSVRGCCAVCRHPHYFNQSDQAIRPVSISLTRPFDLMAVVLYRLLYSGHQRHLSNCFSQIFGTIGRPSAHM